jgi:uncharacterized protein
VRIIIWIVRILAVLLLVRMILSALFGARRKKSTSGSRGPGPAQERLGGELVRDPNCGTYVPKARAVISGSGDAALYFCSATCCDAYEKVRSEKSEVRG